MRREMMGALVKLHFTRALSVDMVVEAHGLCRSQLHPVRLISNRRETATRRQLVDSRGCLVPARTCQSNNKLRLVEAKHAETPVRGLEPGESQRDGILRSEFFSPHSSSLGSAYISTLSRRRVRARARNSKLFPEFQ